MDYMIAHGENRLSLAAWVKELCSRGWKPQGGVEVSPESVEERYDDSQGRIFVYKLWYYQAMVKQK